AAAPAAAPGGAALEYLLVELAHELRNPLVTIKTFADHLPALLEDAELRARFATLTSEAIERMDGLLENVLAFARLGAPRREAVEVGPIMARVLAELEPELAGRAVRVRQAAAPTARCAADPAHLAYALRNLFAGVVREVPARAERGRRARGAGIAPHGAQGHLRGDGLRLRAGSPRGARGEPGRRRPARHRDAGRGRHAAPRGAAQPLPEPAHHHADRDQDGEDRGPGDEAGRLPLHHQALRRGGPARPPRQGDRAGGPGARGRGAAQRGR